MALEKGVNSFATVEEADAYFENRLDVAAWDEASEELKAKALVTATTMLNSYDWIGAAVSEDQTLAFPRSGVYYEPVVGAYKELSASSIPDRIVRAVIEQAYHLLNNDGLLDNTGFVKNITVGTIQLQMIGSPSSVPKVVSDFIRPLLQNRGSRSWWRAN